MFLRPYLCSAWQRPVLRLPQSQFPWVFSPRTGFFSSIAHFRQKQSNKDGDVSEDWSSEPQKQRRRGARSPAAPTSLRRVAVEAQRSRDSFISRAQLKEQGFYQTKVSEINVVINSITDVPFLESRQ